MFTESRQLPQIRRLALVLAGLCGLTGILIEYGTYPGPGLLAAARVLSGLAVGLFLVEQGLAWLGMGSFRKYLGQRWPTFVLSVLLGLQAVGLLVGRDSVWLGKILSRLDAQSLTRAYLIILQIYLVAVLAVELPHLHQRFARRRVRPATAFVILFAAMILIGAGFLMLPRATPADQPINFLDALFTSTSAVCVTGLIVRETGTGFTVFGQSVILVLIQLGGLGIMSLTAALGMLLGRGIGVRESSLLREVFQVPMIEATGRVIRFIILMTLVLETAGALLYYRALGPIVDVRGERVFAAVFHAVSAFCNSGFSTFGESLTGLADRPLFMGVTAALLIIGGLGFGVIAQILAWMRGRALGRRDRRSRLGLHEKTVLSLTAVLLLAGTAALALLEWNGALAGSGGPIFKLSQAFFQSATCRTAGFNSLDLTLLSPASLFLMILLMFVGGAPGSTAGGVKVTTLAVVWANVRAVGAGSDTVRLGRRQIDPVIVQRAMLVLSGCLVVAAGAIFLLLAVEKAPLLDTTFEVFSALGTVGLSLGLTGLLSPVGRTVVLLLMFFGRLGPLTLAASLTGVGRESRVRLPRGRIMVG